MATIELTTWTRLKTLYGITPSVATNQRQTQAEQVIKQVSRQVARWLDAEFKEEARVEIHDVEAGQHRFVLRAFPVDTGSTFEVRNDQARTFSGSALNDSNYALDDDLGILQFDDDYELVSGPRVLQVTYTGGLAANVAAFVADATLLMEYGDLVLAVEEQVLFELSRAPHFGATSISASGGNKSFEQPVHLLPSVIEKLEAYIRG